MTFPWLRGRSGLAARILLTVGSLVPYWPLLTFNVIYITDDYFASDIFNGELPGRALVGSLLRRGEWPAWTTQLCSGIPLAGVPADPIGLAAFTLLPPAPALDLYLIVLLLVAAHGAYSLARRFDVDHAGAVLAGLAFAGSGYFACQLKHLGIVATVVWLPVGLLLIDRVLTDGERRPGEAATSRTRLLDAALFGIVFAQQVLAAFPQSAHICALVYGSFALFRALQHRRRFVHPRAWLAWLGVLGVAIALGAACGAVVLLPLSQLGAVSDRAGALTYDWATRLAYWPRNLITFFFPYGNGDISNNTYGGPPFFWEDYGYVGFFTVLLAIYGALRDRRRPIVLFTILMTIVAMLFVLGRATPIYEVAWLLIPGLKTFRFPTRFLIVVELGLALLAAVGVTRLRRDLETRWPSVPALRSAGVILCALTALDLSVHQPRQNPMVAAGQWLAPPHSVEVIRADTPAPRTFTPRHRDFHREAFLRAHGWADVTPYFDLREALEPNTGGGFWNTPSADCYAGISARWTTDVWGDHNREQSLAAMLTVVDFPSQTLRTHPALVNVLRTFGVTHVISPYPQKGAPLALLRQDPHAYIYRVEGTARVRFVPGARAVKDDQEAFGLMLRSDFDPGREVLLHDASETSPAVSGTDHADARVAIVAEDSRHIAVDVDAPGDGYVLLGDTYYPGWTASIDGVAGPLFRADLAARAVPVRRGRHRVEFTYELPGLKRGATISAIAIAMLFVWAAGAARSRG